MIVDGGQSNQKRAQSQMKDEAIDPQQESEKIRQLLEYLLTHG
jgi:hypothetical protein